MENRVRSIRKARQMTLRRVADAVGCSVGFLSDVELGHRGAKEETWQRIADAMGVTTDELKGGSNDDDGREAEGA